MAEQASFNSSAGESSQPSRTGLTPWLGFFGVLAFGLAGLGLSRMGDVLLEIIPGRWPGINLLLVVVIALIAGLVFSITFSAIGVIVRRPAPDYVLASRLISPPLAFASSWTFVIALCLFAGSAAGSLARQFLPNSFKTLGTVFGMRDVLPLADAARTPQVAILVGTVLVIIAFLTMTMPPKTLSGLLKIGLVFVIISWMILFFQFSSSHGASFTAAYEQVFGSGTYTEHIELAYQYGMDTSVPGMNTVWLIGLFSAFFLFIGAALPAQLSGEVTRPGKSLIPGSLTATLICGGIIVAALLFLQRVVPVQFIAAQSYLSQKQIDFTGLAMPWLPFYAAIVKPTVWMAVTVFVTWAYLLFLVVEVLMFVISRIVLAWSRDLLVSERISFIHIRQRTPLLALLISAAAIQIGLIDAVQGGKVLSSLHLPIIFAVTQLLPVTALVLYPLLRKKASGAYPFPAIIQGLIGFAGLVTLAYFIWTLASFFVYPVRLQNLQPATFILLGICLASGVTWFYVRRGWLRRRGIELEEKFHSMPQAD